jgi:predicted Holliday junction resolvase-like endonuclease
MVVEWIFIGILSVIVIALVLKDRKRSDEVYALADELAQVQVADKLQQAKKDVLDKSSQIVKGKVLEHFSPYFPNFPYNPQDARFLGSPIDFIVFDGLAEGELRKIVFVEVKTGSQDRKLPKREQMVKECIETGKIEWIYIQHPILQPTPPQVYEEETQKTFWDAVKNWF